jgi:hypothetical protein
MSHVIFVLLLVYEIVNDVLMYVFVFVFGNLLEVGLEFLSC